MKIDVEKMTQKTEKMICPICKTEAKEFHVNVISGFKGDPPCYWRWFCENKDCPGVKAENDFGGHSYYQWGSPSRECGCRRIEISVNKTSTKE